MTAPATKLEQHWIPNSEKRAVVLLSGGMDSCLVAAMCVRYGWDVDALTVEYGQRHSRELDAARRIAACLGIRHHEIKVPLGQLVPSALTGDGIMATRTLEEIRADKRLSPAYVPGRNGVFLSLALAFADAHGLGAICIGATIEDEVGFPDCRRAFFDGWETLGTAMLGRPLSIITPLILSPKVEVVRMARNFDAPLHLTVTCYQQTHVSCGRCDACLLRRDAFAAAGETDPARYAVDL